MTTSVPIPIYTDGSYPANSFTKHRYAAPNRSCLSTHLTRTRGPRPLSDLSTHPLWPGAAGKTSGMPWLEFGDRLNVPTRSGDALPLTLILALLVILAGLFVLAALIG